MIQELEEATSKGISSIEEAKRIYIIRQRLREDLFAKADKEIAKKYPEIIFYRLFTSEKLSSYEIGDLRNFVKTKDITWQKKIMVVSALTLSLLKKFDPDRISILIDFINYYEEEVWERAFTGLVLSLHSIPLKTFKMQYPYNQIYFLRKNDYIQSAYEMLAMIMNENIHKFRIELDSLDSILQELPRLFQAEELPLILYFFQNILPNMIEDNYISIQKLCVTITDITFFQENQMHHWFLGFDKNNPLVNEAIWNSKKDIDESFIETFDHLPIGNIMKHALIFSLKDRSKDEILFMEKMYTNLAKIFTEQFKKEYSLEYKYFNPIFSFLSDLYLFELYYPREDKEQIIQENIDLFNSSLIDILLQEESRKKLLAQSYFQSGSAHDDLGNYDQAIQDYTEAIKIKPDKHEAYYNRGNAHAAQQNYEQAIQDYTEAIKIKPDKHEAYNNRGVAYYNQQNYEQAIQDYTEAIKIKPDYHEAYSNRGNAHAAQQNYEQAIQDYTEAIEITGEDANTLANLSQSLFLNNEDTKAISSIEKVLSLKPEGTDLLSEVWFYIYAHIKDRMPEAAEHLDQLIEKANGEPLSKGWNLQYNIKKAILEGHTNIEKLKYYAEKITGE